MRITLAHHTIIAFAMLFAALFLPSLAENARADIKGPCAAGIRKLSDNDTTLTTVNQIGSPGSAFKVADDEPVVVVMQAEPPRIFEYHRFQLEFAGIKWTIAEEFDSDTEGAWVEAFNVGKYATYGKGLYKVIGYGRLKGGEECIGIAYVDVGGNPLTAFAGAFATAGTALGLTGVALAAATAAGGGKDPLDPDKIGDKLDLMARQEELDAELGKQRRAAEAASQIKAELEVMEKGLASGNPFCVLFLLPALLLTGMTMAAGSGGQSIAPAPATRRRRVSWRPRLSALGMFGGLLAGAGVVVLLQQFSVLYPTLAIAIIGLVGGLLLGILVPSLGGLIRVRRVNRKLARLEARLKELERQHGIGGGQI